MGLHGPWGELQVFIRVTSLFPPRDYPYAKHPNGISLRNPPIPVHDQRTSATGAGRRGSSDMPKRIFPVIVHLSIDARAAKIILSQMLLGLVDTESFSYGHSAILAFSCSAILLQKSSTLVCGSTSRNQFWKVRLAQLPTAHLRDRT